MALPLASGVQGPFLDFPNNVTLHELFQQQSKKTPNAVALVDDGQHGGENRLTYQQLDELSEVKPTPHTLE